jgi:hypothetical protein
MLTFPVVHFQSCRGCVRLTGVVARGRIHKQDRPLDRKRVHSDIGMFFNQFEPPSHRRLLERVAAPAENEIDRLRRGGYSYSLKEKEQMLGILQEATEEDGTVLAEAYAAAYSPDSTQCLHALQYIVKVNIKRS